MLAKTEHYYDTSVMAIAITFYKELVFTQRNL